MSSFAQKFAPKFVALTIVLAATRSDARPRSGPVLDRSGRAHYIVFLRDGATRGLSAAPHRDRFAAYHKPQARRLVAELERRHGVTADGMTSWVDTSFSAFLTPAQHNALRTDPRVERISQDAWLDFSADAGSLWTDSTLPGGEIASWGRRAVNPFGSSSAERVTVYVVDGGVGGHPDLNVIRRVNGAHPDDTEPSHLVGCYPHPTHVAGILGAKANGSGVIGIDPGVPIVSVSVLGPATNGAAGGCVPGNFMADNVRKALDWVYGDITASGKIGIVNLSLNDVNGTFTFSATSDVGTAMRRLATPTPGYPGAFIAHSAGNQYEDACSHAFNAPSPSDGILVVGALNDHGQPVVPLNGLNSFRNGDLAGSEPGSNFGGCVEVWAPGNAIVSTWDSGVQPLSGTSMAAPHVTGLAAYLTETQGLGSPAAIENAVRGAMMAMQTVDKARLPVFLATLHPGPVATPYGEFRISNHPFTPAFDSGGTNAPANGTQVLYADDSNYTLSFDSWGSPECDVTLTENGTTTTYWTQMHHFTTSRSASASGTWSSRTCPSGSATIDFRQPPAAHWFFNSVERTGQTIDWAPGRGVLSFASSHATNCTIGKERNDAGRYIPVETIGNAGTGNEIAIIPPSGDWRYYAKCFDAYGADRNAIVFLHVTIPPPIPVSGMWWNPARSGAGWSLSVNVYGTVLLYWFTYTASGSPTWYMSTMNVAGSAYTGALYSTTWNGSSAQLVYRGSVSLALTSSTSGSISWTLDGLSRTEPIERQVFGTPSGSAPRLTGAWYPPSESGWGIALDVQGNTAVAEVASYDWAGQPVWFYGTGDATNGPLVNLSTITSTGLCPGCTGPISTAFAPAGWMQVYAWDAPQTSAYLLMSITPYVPFWDRSFLPISRITF